MKLTNRSLLSIAATLSLCFASHESIAQDKVENSGFEAWGKVKNPKRAKCEFTKDIQPSKWNIDSSAYKKTNKQKEQCTPDYQTFHGGKCSVKLFNPAPKGLFRVVRFCSIPVQSGKFYKFSCWIKGNNIKFNPSKRNSGIVMQFIPGSQKNYWSDKKYINKTFRLDGNFDWQQISCIFPVEGKKDITGIGIGLWDASGTLWVDDINLEEVSKNKYIAEKKTNIKSTFTTPVWREHYGPAPRQIFSLYQPKTTKPAPVLVYIHGGGWLGGNGVDQADLGHRDGMIRYMNSKGIAVAVINYRLGSLPTPVYDAARAIQYLRHNAEKYNLDKDKFAVSGFSAGATSSLWLALHDDLADPKSTDPVLRESTRLKGAFIYGVQSSIDPVTLRKWKLEKAMEHQMICRAAGFKSNKAMDAGYESKKNVYKEFSPINHADKNDPPVRIDARTPLSSQRDWIHHPRFAYEYKKHADKVGAPCELALSSQDSKLVKPPTDRSGYDFIVRILTQ